MPDVGGDFAEPLTWDDPKKLAEELSERLAGIQRNFDRLASQFPLGAQNLQRGPWTTVPTLQNGWTASGGVPPEYMIDALGYVQCRGEIVAGTVTVDTLLFTFPAGSRPSARAYCPAVSNLDAGRAVYVDGGGAVKLAYAVTAAAVINLNALRFPTF